MAPRSRNIGETRGTPLHLYVPETGVPHVSLFLRHPSAPLRAGSGRGHFECSLVTDRSFGFFYSPFMTEGLPRIYGGNDLHFLTFSCYRRRPLFRNEARCDLFLKILDPVRRRYRFVVLGYVVMPEHVHLLVSEPQRETLSTAIQALKIGFVRSFQCSGGSVVAVAPRSRNIGETWGTPFSGTPVTGTPVSDTPLHPERFWQARFYDFNVWTARKRIEKLRYIHRNPFERGLVSSPEQWRWSSFRWYLCGEVVRCVSMIRISW